MLESEREISGFVPNPDPVIVTGVVVPAGQMGGLTLSMLGVGSPTTAGDAPGRQRLIEAYCDALEGREPGDDGPGS